MKDSGEFAEVTARIARVREAMLDRVLAGLALVAAVGAPVSVARAWLTGWMAVYSMHLILGAVVIVAFLVRRRLPVVVRVGVVISVCWLVGLIGLIHFGPMGAGVWWITTSALLVGVLYGLRAAVPAVIALVVVVVAVGAAFVTGMLTISFDPAAYLTSVAAWATLLVGVAMMPWFVFAAVSVLHENMIALLGESERQRLQILDLSLRDELTGLPRMRLARDRLGKAIAVARRTQEKVAVLFLDLDGFKAVNDRHGHAAGDAVLRAVAERIRASIREQDSAARLGGDEFLVVLVNPTSEDEAVRVAHRIRDSIRRRVPSDAGELRVGASIGLAMFPDDAQDGESLIGLADSAMYAIKKQPDKGVLRVSVLPPVPHEGGADADRARTHEGKLPAPDNTPRVRH